MKKLITALSFASALAFSGSALAFSGGPGGPGGGPGGPGGGGGPAGPGSAAGPGPGGPGPSQEVIQNSWPYNVVHNDEPVELPQRPGSGKAGGPSNSDD